MQKSKLSKHNMHVCTAQCAQIKVSAVTSQQTATTRAEAEQIGSASTGQPGQRGPTYSGRCREWIRSYSSRSVPSFLYCQGNSLFRIICNVSFFVCHLEWSREIDPEVRKSRKFINIGPITGWQNINLSSGLR